MSWILRRSQRPALHERIRAVSAGHRPSRDGRLRFRGRVRPLRIPATLIVDADGDALYPLSAPTWHDADGRAALRRDCRRARSTTPFSAASTRSRTLRPRSISMPQRWRRPSRSWNRLVGDGRAGPVRPSARGSRCRSSDRRSARRRSCRSSRTRKAARRMTSSSACSTRSARRSRGCGKPARSAACSGTSTCPAEISPNAFVGGRIAGREAARAALGRHAMMHVPFDLASRRKYLEQEFSRRRI